MPLHTNIINKITTKPKIEKFIFEN